MMRLSSFCFLLGLMAVPLCGLADKDEAHVGSGREAFAQLGQELPDPNVYRTPVPRVPIIGSSAPTIA